jgi:hypothetical protein
MNKKKENKNERRIDLRIKWWSKTLFTKRRNRFIIVWATVMWYLRVHLSAYNELLNSITSSDQQNESKTKFEKLTKYIQLTFICLFNYPMPNMIIDFSHWINTMIICCHYFILIQITTMNKRWDVSFRSFYIIMILKCLSFISHFVYKWIEYSNFHFFFFFV